MKRVFKKSKGFLKTLGIFAKENTGPVNDSSSAKYYVMVSCKS